MRISVLGPLTVGSELGSSTPKAAKQKRVLALLVVRANTVVSTGQLMEELWGSEPPDSATATLQTYVANLRKFLAMVLGRPHSVRDILSTSPGGYQFRAQPGELDAEEFTLRANQGIRALAAGQDQHAAETLRAALGLWRGPALADVPPGRLLETHVNRLEQARLAVTEQRVEADLRLGRHHGLLGELTELTTTLPLNENLHAKFMLALYRSGRRYEALSVFQRLRETLSDELGLVPTASLERLHRAILLSDPVLDLPADPRPRTALDNLIGSLSHNGTTD
ncbi:AfsR/SARP family transcriptional regulator [Actinokineospora auranticolor]|uniref:DNA-binding SARP family transcriptional activator n=1 Tax=Actinokineospora auranticolor TaxID=155976 RepID=A0A2S6GPM3_9PSEU|nr:AfsR/SARP family transcriptional regulator [Actinokineospora auranticolor]PPK67205.1 DNA-binding SARP family transcriptional activator [Actinokineospora auranticolor]